MFIAGRALGAMTMALAFALVGTPAWAYERPAGNPEGAVPRISSDAHTMAQWVQRTGDNRGRPFAIMDKKSARFVVFDGRGRVIGAAAALIGLAPGDHAVPGIGARPLSQILPEERTTPAGRFASEPGRNLDGESVVWVDYDAGFAIHRLRPGPAQERRQERLMSSSPADNRVSLGCIVVAGSFYDSVVAPVLGARKGVVYVLPETRPVQEFVGTTMAAPAPAASKDRPRS